MVSWTGLRTLLNDSWLDAFLLAQKGPQIPLRRLDGPTRAKVLAALAGLIILGFGMVALVWLGARFTRRYMRSGERAARQHEFAEDWASRPLVRNNPLVDIEEEADE